VPPSLWNTLLILASSYAAYLVFRVAANGSLTFRNGAHIDHNKNPRLIILCVKSFED